MGVVVVVVVVMVVVVVVIGCDLSAVCAVTMYVCDVWVGRFRCAAQCAGGRLPPAGHRTPAPSGFRGHTAW